MLPIDGCAFFHLSRSDINPYEIWLLPSFCLVSVCSGNNHGVPPRRDGSYSTGH